MGRHWTAVWLRTKPLADLQHDGTASGLRRALGPWDLVGLGIGAIIGAGIFATVGTAAAGDAARPGAGPAIILSFVLTAAACGLAALCYAELAALVPISGSAYTYAYATLGELAAWIIGWDLIIEYAVGNVAVAISWSGYFCEMLRGVGIIVPPWLSTDLRTALANKDLLASAPHVLGVPFIVNLPAAGIVLALTWLLVRGVKESARFNAGMVITKLVVLAFFVVVGVAYVQPQNWKPFAPNGWHGIWAGAAIVFFAYIGFDAVSTVAEETRNPGRNLPIGILGSLAISTFVYILVAAVVTGMVPWNELHTAEPLTVAMNRYNLGWAAGIVAVGSVAAHTAVLLVFQMGQPRIFYSMARDGLLPPTFARVHPRFHTPHVTTILTGVVVAAFAAFANIEEMVDLTNIGTLFAFVVVSAGVIVLRRTNPEARRPFRVPLVPWLPSLAMAGCLLLAAGLPRVTWLRFALWLGAGLVIFLLYGRHHSRLSSPPSS
ncbi:MAG TPA: amino acid permease [Thermoanaerobaculaceae bacterium]|nr:amino acid permease [Thermoanaerobaculaceae bacterium]HPS77201.1 amino acid permease [Thermoanaerobaculaceae bacterium]